MSAWVIEGRVTCNTVKVNERRLYCQSRFGKRVKKTASRGLKDVVGTAGGRRVFVVSHNAPDSEALLNTARLSPDPFELEFLEAINIKIKVKVSERGKKSLC